MSVNGADLTERDYLDVAEAAVAAARQAGAEEAEAAVSAGNDFSATVRQGKTEKLLESGSKGLSLRVFVGGAGGLGLHERLCRCRHPPRGERRSGPGQDQRPRRVRWPAGRRLWPSSRSRRSGDV